MDEISSESLAIALAALLIASGFFSVAETAMMAVNRYRLKHRAQRGNRGAKMALALLAQTDKLLGVILLGNNLINAAAATLTAVLAARLFGEGKLVLAAGTVVDHFLILVFSEITPKVIGAAHADRIAPVAAFLLTPLLKPPFVWIVAFVNIFVQGLLKLLRIKSTSDSGTTLTQEELRSLVLEGSQYFRGKHRTMLANLMDLEAISVDDVMTPRSQIHALDLAEKPALLRQQLATSYHSRVPVYEDTLDSIVGILPLKSVVHLQQTGEIDAERLRPLLRPPYFVPGRHAAVDTVATVPGRSPAAWPRRRRVRRVAGARHDRGHRRGDHRRVHHPGAGRHGYVPARTRRQHRGRRHDAVARAQPASWNAIPAGWSENAQRAHRRAFGRHSGRRHQFQGGRAR